MDNDIDRNLKKGIKISPERGHSLGMGNELTTLVQVIISRMVRKNVLFEKKVSIDIWNDDFRCHGTLEDVVAYREIDLKIINDLDYPLSEEKTRILDGATVFLEEYNFADKEIQYLKENRKVCNLVEMAFARNIYEAKEFSRSIYETLEGFFIDNKKASELYMKIICDWGYEFHKNELILPARLGGWFTCRYCYLDETFNLRSFNECDLKLLTKLARAEEAEVNMK